MHYYHNYYLERQNKRPSLLFLALFQGSSDFLLTKYLCRLKKYRLESYIYVYRERQTEGEGKRKRALISFRWEKLWRKKKCFLKDNALSFTFSSVQFSCSVMSDLLQPHELQHARPPCPQPTSRLYSNSCPLSRWCHPAISSSVIPCSSCPQSLPASGSFQMSQLFA